MNYPSDWALKKKKLIIQFDVLGWAHFVPTTLRRQRRCSEKLSRIHQMLLIFSSLPVSSPINDGPSLEIVGGGRENVPGGRYVHTRR